MQNFLKQNKKLYYFISIFILLIIGVGTYFGHKYYEINKAEKQVLAINNIINSNTENVENCSVILDFDKTLIKPDNIYFREAKYDNFKENCSVKYDILRSELSLEFCSEIIKGQKNNFTDKYIIIDGFADIQKQCTSKYLTAKFSTGSFFDIENDFKSYININFSLPFYEDSLDSDSEKFIENRVNAKKRLVNILDIQPKINFDETNLVLYKNKAILELELEPLVNYNFSLKTYSSSSIEGEEVKSEKFSFTTPENKYFGIKIKQKVSLFSDTNSPDFELLSYDSGKNGAKIKICRIENETYAKIEVFKEGGTNQKNEFFKSGIDKLKYYECKEKEVVFENNINNSELKSETETETELLKLQKIVFNFNDVIGSPSRSGLYYVTFADNKDRDFNGIIQEPILFGVIDSHITMKISKSGEGFFFVNDLNGNPLVNQKIKAYVNTFISKNKKWDRTKKDYDITYNSSLDKNVFGTGITLGITGEDGVLKVDIKDKIDDIFNKTLSSRNYDWDGNYNSLFVSSASDSNLSYVSSKWNGGISGWNFGYTIGNSWWYGGASENADEITLKRNGREEPNLYSHVYTDRKIYLPGEDVHIKTVVRKSSDLSIPENKTLNIKVKNPKGEVIINSNINLSEYGSLSEKINLKQSAGLGNYSIFLYDEEEQIGTSGFSVEVFKNPKFKNEISIKTEGLNNNLVKISKTDIVETNRGYERKTYKGDFTIKASILSKYYSGSPVKNAKFDYKIYKQYYYDNSYWDDCFYGCYWEPEKELYTEGKGTLDENGFSNISTEVEFDSTYSDYKYIVEVSVEDTTGDKIAGTNSIIAKLPSEYKRWDPNSGIYFQTEKRFYKTGEKLTINGGLNIGDFTTDYNDKFLLIIKKKEYITHNVDDVRGYSRPVTKIEEKIDSILEVNDENFTIMSDGKLKLNYNLDETGEYIFEFGKINSELFFDYKILLSEFIKTGEKELKKEFNGKIKANWQNVDRLFNFCDSSKEDCDRKGIVKKFGCTKNYVDDVCRNKEVDIKLNQVIKVDDLINTNSRKYFSIISYGDLSAKNPVQSDNKITVLSEKISYKLGETARILVRLPFNNGKILWTIEKQGVLKYEYIDVPGNTFFKEIVVDDTFVPNAYIGVVVIDTNNDKIPEYKVGYTEIVVDKTDKKTDITIKSDKETYKPREEVILEIKASNASELTVMVVDDSLISLMGNVDLNTLEKFYKKLSFQIQTSITNLAMLRNYYFSRQGIVGGSGYGNFKGGDSMVSSRNIFKNTAYYNPSVITDNSGKAQVKFMLPDNLTNFRVMVISNSKDNFFGFAESFIEVRKDVIIEDKIPLIIRGGDEIELGANIFNMSEQDIGFKASLIMEGVEIEDDTLGVSILAGESKFIKWRVKNTSSCDEYSDICTFPYKITVLGDTKDHSDKIEGEVEIKASPILKQTVSKNLYITKGEQKDLSIDLPSNTNIEKSKYKLYISNNPLSGINKILSSLAVYPYGCIEQTLSSTMPNAVLKRFKNILDTLSVDNEKINNNLNAGIARMKSMQTESGGFTYWQGDSKPDLAITPYVLRTLLEIKDSGLDVEVKIINKAVSYLEKNYVGAEQNTKLEILWTLSKYNKGNYIGDKLSPLGIENLTDSFDSTKMSRHDLIAHTYSLVLADPIKYKYKIDSNIVLLKTKINEKNSYNYSIHYYDSLDDKAIFTSMLIDYGYNTSYISELIIELYNRDWSSYYYSTKTKNDSFLAFVKYIEKYGKNNITDIKITLNGNSKTTTIGGGEKNINTTELNLEEVLKANKVSLQIENITGSPLFVTSSIESYPQDVEKIPAYSSGVSLKREIYEVIDESDIEEECKYVKNNDKKTTNSGYGEYICTQAKGLKLHTGNVFKKGVTYKIKLIAKFDDDKSRKNFVFEDYLPSSFTIINLNFKTNSIVVAKNATRNNSWSWDYTENRPEVMMAHAKNLWGDEATYEYFITPNFIGNFNYPPVTAYMMYDPEIRANGVFRKIVVK